MIKGWRLTIYNDLLREIGSDGTACCLWPDYFFGGETEKQGRLSLSKPVSVMLYYSSEFLLL